MVTPWRLIKGAEPDALKGASPVLNGGDEETGLVRPRLVATQLECDNAVPSCLALGGGARCATFSHGASPTSMRSPRRFRVLACCQAASACANSAVAHSQC